MGSGTEINIFIALMHLFGINIYLENEEASIIPDPLYVGEIQKIIKTKLKEHPMCIAKANAEERAFVVNVVLDIIDNLYRKCNRLSGGIQLHVSIHRMGGQLHAQCI